MAQIILWVSDVVWGVAIGSDRQKIVRKIFHRSEDRAGGLLKIASWVGQEMIVSLQAAVQILQC